MQGKSCLNYSFWTCFPIGWESWVARWPHDRPSKKEWDFLQKNGKTGYRQVNLCQYKGVTEYQKRFAFASTAAIVSTTAISSCFYAKNLLWAVDCSSAVGASLMSSVKRPGFPFLPWFFLSTDIEYWDFLPCWEGLFFSVTYLLEYWFIESP